MYLAVDIVIIIYDETTNFIMNTTLSVAILERTESVIYISIFCKTAITHKTASWTIHSGCKCSSYASYE